MRRIVLALAILLTPRIADACDPASHFELFDRAQRVVVGTVTTPEARRNYGRPGRVTVAVDHSLKGDARGSISVRADVGMCAAELNPGARALLFLDADGAVVGAMEGYHEFPDPTVPDPLHRLPERRWVEILTRWAQAGDDLGHLDVLIELMNEPELSGLPNQASDHLVNTPRLLAQIDAPRRQRIAAALARHRWHPNYTLLVLARLRAPELVPLLDAGSWSYEEELRAMLAVDRFQSVTDRTALADAITAAASTPATRAAALDRCELLLGRSIERYVMYLYDASRRPDAVDWTQAAAMCRP